MMKLLLSDALDSFVESFVGDVDDSTYHEHNHPLHSPSRPITDSVDRQLYCVVLGPQLPCDYEAITSRGVEGHSVQTGFPRQAVRGALKGRCVGAEIELGDHPPHRVDLHDKVLHPHIGIDVTVDELQLVGRTEGFPSIYNRQLLLPEQVPPFQRGVVGEVEVRQHVAPIAQNQR